MSQPPEIDDHSLGDELVQFVREGGLLRHLLAYFGLSSEEFMQAGLPFGLASCERFIARRVICGDIATTSGQVLTADEVRDGMRRLLTEVYAPHRETASDRPNPNGQEYRMPSGVSVQVERSYRDLLTERGHPLLSSSDMDHLAHLLSEHAKKRKISYEDLIVLLLELEPFFERDRASIQALRAIYEQLAKPDSDVDAARDKLCERALNILSMPLSSGDAEKLIFAV